MRKFFVVLSQRKLFSARWKFICSPVPCELFKPKRISRGLKKVERKFVIENLLQASAESSVARNFRQSFKKHRLIKAFYDSKISILRENFMKMQQILWKCRRITIKYSLTHYRLAANRATETGKLTSLNSFSWKFISLRSARKIISRKHFFSVCNQTFWKKTISIFASKFLSTLPADTSSGRNFLSYQHENFLKAVFMDCK